MTTRRRFLGTLGKALGAGGLLLPWTGKGALALPADLGTAAQIPVKAAPLPFSADALEMRKIRRALAALPNTHHPDGGPWRRMMLGEYMPLKKRVAARPVRSWTDCVELAEAIWAFWEKGHRDGPYTGPMTSKLATDDGSSMGSAYHQRHLIVALVEGVLSLGGGERFDPRMKTFNGEEEV